MRILLTGGAGFIGGHVAEKLIQRGDQVIVCDNLNDYYDTSVKKETLRLLQKTAKVACKDAGECGSSFCIHVVDLTDQGETYKIFRLHGKIDKVLHLAAQAGVRHSLLNPTDVVRSNVIATVCLLELCQRMGVRDFIYASSSSVYGEANDPPFSEGQPVRKPISQYAASKSACELFAYTYHHLYGMQTTGLRFFTVYGPRGRPDMACLKFIMKMDRGEPIDKYGDGSAIREFTYVDDIVSGVVAAVDRELVPDCLVVNLGGGSTHTLNDLIASIESHLGRSAIVRQLDPQSGDVPVTRACQKCAIQYLRFRPKVSLDEGIRRTVEWYRDSMSSMKDDTMRDATRTNEVKMHLHRQSFSWNTSPVSLPSTTGSFDPSSSPDGAAVNQVVTWDPTLDPMLSKMCADA